MISDNKINHSSNEQNDSKKEISANDDEAILKNNPNTDPKESKEDSDEFMNQNEKAQNADTVGIP